MSKENENFYMKFEHYWNQVSLIWGTADLWNLRNYYLKCQILENDYKWKRKVKTKNMKKELRGGYFIQVLIPYD